MKIGVVGSGVVAQTLGAGFLKHGHEVTLGTREAGKLEDWAAKNPGAEVGDFAAAAAFGEIVVLAVGGAVALEALKLVGAANIAGKTVIDACNPIGGGPPVHGVLTFFTSLTDSLMERLQKAYPAAHFVKAFNSVGAAQMVDPHFSGGKPTMFICGDDERGQTRRDGAARSVRLGDRGHGRRSRRRARSSLCACSGASPASPATTGRRTPSSCCGEGGAADGNREERRNERTAAPTLTCLDRGSRWLYEVDPRCSHNYFPFFVYHLGLDSPWPKLWKLR